jgi:hypothetical protein
MYGAQTVFASSVLGGCSPGLLAQRSTCSMTFWWLGRTGLAASGSSESLRGNLTSSVMAFLPLKENARPLQLFNDKPLILLHIFTHLETQSPLVELSPNWVIE